MRPGPRAGELEMGEHPLTDRGILDRSDQPHPPCTGQNGMLALAAARHLLHAAGDLSPPGAAATMALAKLAGCEGDVARAEA